jgi:predicted thioesterase
MTARAVASGSVPVLATPMMIALMEKAAFDALRPYLEPGETTVGTRVDIRHLAATPEGDEVVCVAEITESRGRKVVFKVLATDTGGKVGEGLHERAVVEEKAFLQAATAKLGRR